jgi:hypothetical protein
MRRAISPFSDDVHELLAQYRAGRENPDSVSETVSTALRECLTQRSCLWRPKGLPRITPAEAGSGDPPGSVEHDRILAGEHP